MEFTRVIHILLMEIEKLCETSDRRAFYTRHREKFVLWLENFAVQIDGHLPDCMVVSDGDTLDACNCQYHLKERPRDLIWDYLMGHYMREQW